tara:strand:- start:101 stop:382 length:282 start_codon:yes stop_codon:yes gene_type:complete
VTILLLLLYLFPLKEEKFSYPDLIHTNVKLFLSEEPFLESHGQHAQLLRARGYVLLLWRRLRIYTRHFLQFRKEKQRKILQKKLRYNKKGEQE